ncbi:MAG TPA: Gfo/Idh/MocA family oxidoreductase [Acidobacteriaceae bacterium]|jgi:predicted dehydrogenase|nr:Gfo/Idh/MocA family oxidoreductase [Acidobacteriaceae bacterium]
MDRRDFIGGAAASGILLLNSRTAFGTEANSAVRLGLLGCGNRGTSVATSFAKNTPARVVALADLFPDQLAAGKTHFDAVNAALGVPGIDPKLMFRGSHAYEELANSKDVDAVQISTPPWFHVQHLDAVVRAGKHAYCEKPLGVDVAQTQQALEIGKRAEGRLSLDVGFEVRSAPPIAEVVRRIHAGDIGRVAAITAHYFAPDAVSHSGTGWSADEFRLRNWLWDLVLSGDIIVEQNIHVIDLCNWILGSHPVKATATGGRSVITHPGDCWDNYQVIFTYPNDVHLSFSSTQWGKGGWFDVTEEIFGVTGIAEAPYSGPVRIIGEKAWSWGEGGSTAAGTPAQFAANGAFSDNLEFADRDKDRAYIESITSGKFHNQTADGVQSALSAMLGRMAGRTGQTVAWEDLLQHGEKYTMNIDMGQFG